MTGRRRRPTPAAGRGSIRSPSSGRALHAAWRAARSRVPSPRASSGLRRRHAGARETRAAPPRARALEARHTPQLAREAHLADRERAPSTGRPRNDEAIASATPRSVPGSSSVQPAGHGHEHVVPPEPQPHAPLEHGEQHREPPRIEAARHALRRARRTRSRPAPAPRPAAGASPRGSPPPRVPGSRRAPAVRQERRARVRAPRQARSRSSRTRPARWSSRSGSWPRAARGSAGSARPRGRARRPPCARARAGPATAPSLVTWPTRNTGVRGALGEVQQRERRTRAPASPCPGRLRGRRATWSGSSPRSPRRAPTCVAASSTASRSVSQRTSSASAERAEPLGAQAHLLLALLARRRSSTRARPPARERARELQQQRALADPGIAAHQQQRAGHDAAAEHAIQLARCRSASARRAHARRRRADAARAARAPAAGTQRARAARRGAPAGARRGGRALRRRCSTRRTPGSARTSAAPRCRTRCRRSGSWGALPALSAPAGLARRVPERAD